MQYHALDGPNRSAVVQRRVLDLEAQHYANELAIAENTAMIGHPALSADQTEALSLTNETLRGQQFQIEVRVAAVLAHANKPTPDADAPEPPAELMDHPV